MPAPVEKDDEGDAPAAAQPAPASGLAGSLAAMTAPKEKEQSPLARSLAQIAEANRDPETLAKLTISRARGNSFGKDNVVLQDHAKLDPVEFALKYSPDVVDQVNNVIAGGEHIQSQAEMPDRDITDVAQDAVLAGAGGAVSGVTGLATLGYRALYGKRMAQDIAQAGHGVHEMLTDAQSDELNLANRFHSIRTQLDSEDNQARFEEDKEKDGSFVANLRSIGRGIGSGIKRMTESGPILMNSAEEGLGMMLPAGPLSKAVGGGATAAESLLTAARVANGARVPVSAAAEAAAGKAIQSAAFPAVNGAMLGGMTYGDTANEIIGTDDAVLKQQSPTYAAMRESMSEADAKSQIADRAGMLAAAVAGVGGVVGGKLVAPFEVNPLAEAMKGGAERFIQAAMRSSVDGGLQSGAGAFGKNVGDVASGANPDKELSEGVGDAIGSGAAAGLAMTTLHHAPGLATAGALSGPRFAWGKLGERADRIREENEKASSVSEDNVRDSFDASRQGHDEMVDAVREDLPERPKAEPATDDVSEQAAQDRLAEKAHAYLDQVKVAHETTPEELSGLPDSLKAKVTDSEGGTLNRFEAGQVLAKVAADPDASLGDRLSAMNYVRKLSETVKGIVVGEPEIIKDLRRNRDREETDPETGEITKVPSDADVPHLKALNDFRDTFNAIRQTKPFIEANKWAREGLPQELAKVDPAKIDASTPEGRSLVDGIAETARHAPESVPAPVLEGVMNHIRDRADVTPETKAEISGALALRKASEASGLDALDRVQPRTEDGRFDTIQDRVSAVRQEISTAEGGAKASLVDHQRAVTDAMRSGDVAGAKKALGRLGDFARSMGNKVDALNQAVANGDGKDVAYQALGPDGKWLPADGKQKVFFHPGNAKSERTANQVDQDARSVANLHNELAKSYPELGAEQLPVPKVDLTGNSAPREVAPAPTPKPAETRVDPAVEAKAKGYEAAADQLEAIGDKETADGLRQRAADLRAQDLTSQETVSGEKGSESSTRSSNTIQRKDLADLAGLERRTEPKASSEGESQPRASDNAPVETAQGTGSDQKGTTQTEGSADPVNSKGNDTKRPTTETSSEKPEENAPDNPHKIGTVAYEYPELTSSRNGNWLTRGFRLSVDKTSESGETSRFSSLVRPIADLVKILRSPEQLSDRLADVARDYKVYSDDLQAMDRMVDTVGNALAKSLEKQLQDGLRKQPNLRRWLGEADPRTSKGVETDPLRIPDALALNLTEKGPDGEIRYNERLAGNAVLAGMDWILNGFGSTSKWTKESLADSLGVQAHQVRDADVEALNRGMDMTRVTQALADRIQKFWGLTPDANVSDSVTKGIPLAMAAEVLHALENAGWLKLEEVKLHPEGGSAKTYKFFTEGDRSAETQELVKSLDKVSTFLGDLALVEREHTGPEREIPKKIPETQIRNDMAKLTEAQKDLVRHENETPYLPNMTVADLVLGLGRDLFRTLMGGEDVESGRVNETDAVSIDGVNKGLDASWRAVEKHVSRILAHAEANGLDPSEVPSYFAHEITKVGRLLQVGEASPVSDKLAREVLTPNRSTLDMTQKANQDLFWLAVGQALGVKTEYNGRAEVRRQAEERIAQPEARRAVDALKEWLADREGHTDRTELPPQSADLHGILKDALGDAPTMHKLHGLLAVAELERAAETGKDLTKHVSHMYLEADGKTNGPANSLMLFGTGPFNGHWLDIVRKAGIFVGEGATSLASWFNSGRNGAKEDLYGLSAANLRTEQARFERGLSKDSPVRGQLQALTRLAGRLGQGLSIENTADGPVLKIDRGFTKNPLTISIYGSGVDGIAGNVTDALVESLMKRMSGLAKDGYSGRISDALNQGIYDGVAKDLVSLFGTPTRRAKGKVEVSRRNDQAFRDLTDQMNAGAAKFAVTPEMYATLKSNVRHLLVDQLSTAVNRSVMGEVSRATDAVQRGTQIQSAVVRAAFTNEVVRLLAEKKANPEKYPDYRPGEALSQADMDMILEKMGKYAPVIEGKDQNFFFSGGESREIGDAIKLPDGSSVRLPAEFARSLAGDITSPATTYQPTLAGVRAIPSLVIGSGDGQAMLNAMRLGIRGLKVFDGLNMPLDKIDEWGRLMNQAAREAMDGNPIADLSRAFDRFAEGDPLKDLLADDVGDGIGNPGRDGLIRDLSRIDPDLGHQELIDRTREALTRLGQEVQARHETLAEHGTSSDQMASAEQPHVVEGPKGFFPEGMADAERVDALNRTYQEKIQAIRGEKVEAPSDPMAKAVESVGRLDGESGVRELKGSELGKVLNAFRENGGKIDGMRGELIRAALPFLARDYKVVFGTSDQLARWEQANHPDRHRPEDAGKFYGKIDFGTKTIQLTPERGIETVLHELIHASTAQKVKAFFDGNAGLSAHDRAAVGRIEALMHEWADQQAGKDELAQGSAYAEVRGHLDAGDRFSAVNEFMAHVLSNQDLARAAAKQSVVAKVFGSALKAIRDLVFGPSSKIDAGDDLLSQLRFNTRILQETDFGGGRPDQDVVLHQSRPFGSDERLTRLREDFSAKEARWREQGPALTRPDRNTETLKATQAVDRAAPAYEAAFGIVSPQEAGTFRAMMHALATGARMDANSLQAVAKIHREVMEKMTVEDLMREGGDPAIERNRAQERHDALNGLLVGHGRMGTDLQGRSTLMSGFLALSQVNGEFRQALLKMASRLRTEERPGRKKVSELYDGVDKRLSDAASAVMDRLGDLASGDRRNADLTERLDALTERLAEIRDDERTSVERISGNAVDRVERFLADGVDKVSGKVISAASRIDDASSNQAVKSLAKITKLVAGVVSRTEAPRVRDGFTRWLNGSDKAPQAIRDLFNDVIGTNKETSPVRDMAAEVKSGIDRVRQQFREELPRIIADKFTRPLRKEEWQGLHRAMAKTDLGALVEGSTTRKTLEMLKDHLDGGQALHGEIDSVESQVKDLAGRNAATVMDKARQLARYMNTGEYGERLLRNAEAIAHIAGRNVPADKLAPLAKAVDRLTSLYAARGMDADAEARIKPLLEREMPGLELALSHLAQLRNTERERAMAGDNSRLNHWKGAMPSLNAPGRSLLVALDSEHARLVSRGYVRLGAYEGSTAEADGFRRSYWFTPTSGQATFNQGVMHIATETAGGVDPRSGYTLGKTLAGRITDRQAVKQIQYDLAAGRGRDTKENLLPIFSNTGELVGYERGIDPRHLARLEPDDSLHSVIGAWSGRQVEEAMSRTSNETLVTRLKQVWDRDREKGLEREYVDLTRLDRKADPVLHEAWRLVPGEAKRAIAREFGEDGFRVRRDMLSDALGYRQASVGDIFTGDTRLSEPVRKQFETLALGLFGNQAYQNLVKSERFVQQAVGNAKTLIVVKSAVVPMANLMGNMLQLVGRGVPVRDVVKGIGTKVAETNAFIKARSEEIQAQSDLAAAKGANDVVAQGKAERRIQAIQDGYKRLSIWPLIEKGEFSSISNGLVNVEDLALANGRWGDYAERLAQKSPAGLKTLVRQGMVTKDTALFAGLSRAAQYGDFVSKAVLYDHLTQRRKVPSDQAISDVSEEFVNYAINPGRMRGYLESTGMLWFYNYKLRSMKVAARTLRERPLTALMLAGMDPRIPGIGHIGTPVTDNALSVLADGKLGYSIGPGMGLGSMRLNPWVHLAHGM